jgi:nucleoside-diphosphate-sugar epimerase
LQLPCHRQANNLSGGCTLLSLRPRLAATALLVPVDAFLQCRHRYSLDSGKLGKLGFRASTNFDEALERTIRWYVENQPWWRAIKEKSAEFREYYARQYGEKSSQ